MDASTFSKFMFVNLKGVCRPCLAFCHKGCETGDPVSVFPEGFRAPSKVEHIETVNYDEPMAL